jgi:hypothetical protein
MPGLSTAAPEARRAWGRRHDPAYPEKNSIETTKLIFYPEGVLCNYFSLIQECIQQTRRQIEAGIPWFGEFVLLFKCMDGY